MMTSDRSTSARWSRRLLAGALALGMLVAVSACGDDDDTTDAGAGSTAAKGSDSTAGGASKVAGFTPVKADTLTIVTSLPGPGFMDGSDSDPTKINGGYEYDIAKAIQAKLGVANVVIRNESFDAIVAGTISDYDLALSQVTITEDRAKVVDFTEPYFDSDQGVLVKAGTKVATLDEAKKLQWGVQTATTGADFVNDKVKPDKQPQVFQQLTEAFTALDAGQIDAVMMDTAIVLSQAGKSGGKVEVAAQFKTGEQYGGILPKGSTNKAVIDEVIKGLKSDGTLASLAQKDLGGDPTKVPVLSAS